MKPRHSLILTLAAVLLASGFAVRSLSKSEASATALASPYGLSYGTPDLKSAGALTFHESILFVADSQSGAVFALDVKESGKDTSSERIEIRNIDQKIASLLGTTPDQIIINDLATHSSSQHVYLSVTRGRGNDARPVILRADRSGRIEELSLSNIAFARHTLADLPAPGEKTPWGESKRTLSITDLAFADGQLLIAGLSNEEFASTLRRVPFPFAEKSAATTLEIYHASHNRYETHAPIETMLPFKIRGEEALLAGYGCAPLASFRMADIASKKHLRGATLAELGGGNRPLDMISFAREGKQRVLIANSDRTLMSLSGEDIDRGEPLTKPVGAAYEAAGVPYLAVAEVGVLQLDDLNSGFVVVIQRNVRDGSLNLRSISKRWL